MRFSGVKQTLFRKIPFWLEHAFLWSRRFLARHSTTRKLRFVINSTTKLGPHLTTTVKEKLQLFSEEGPTQNLDRKSRLLRTLKRVQFRTTKLVSCTLIIRDIVTAFSLFRQLIILNNFYKVRPSKT